MAKNISIPEAPVKSADKRNAELRKTEARYRARIREQRREEAQKPNPLTQSLGDLLAKAGVS